VNFNLDEECLLHVTIQSNTAVPKEVLLATRDTPEALKVAWQEENEKRRLAAEREMAESAERQRGLFSAIRKVFTGE
jgi:hypothetical protein